MILPMASEDCTNWLTMLTWHCILTGTHQPVRSTLGFTPTSTLKSPYKRKLLTKFRLTSKPSCATIPFLRDLNLFQLSTSGNLKKKAICHCERLKVGANLVVSKMKIETGYQVLGKCEGEIRYFQLKLGEECQSLLIETYLMFLVSGDRKSLD